MKPSALAGLPDGDREAACRNIAKARERRAWLLARYAVNPRCAYCSRKTNPWLPEDDDLFATIDHYVPRSKGGCDKRSNWKLCCRQCNFVKGDLTAREFLALLND